MAEKPGIETTEAMAGLGGVLSAIVPMMTSGNSTVQLAAIGAITLIAVAYIWSRTRVKAGETK